MADAKIYCGANIENASFGLTICAERVAVFNAVSKGARRFRALAMVCPDAANGAPPGLRMPCGACRQVVAEFADEEIVVVVGGVGEFLLSELLPAAFKLRR